MSPVVRVLASVCAPLVLVVLVACGSSQTAADTSAASPPQAGSPAPQPASRLLDPAGFAAAVADPRITVINVHVPYAGDIPGTRLSIPFDRIGTDIARLPADRHARLALYCRTGPMSTVAARALAARGYTDIVELSGGMEAWTRSGRPLLGRP